MAKVKNIKVNLLSIDNLKNLKALDAKLGLFMIITRTIFA